MTSRALKETEKWDCMHLLSIPVAFGSEAAKWICVGAIDVTQISVAGFEVMCAVAPVSGNHSAFGFSEMVKAANASGAGKPYHALSLLGLIVPHVFFQLKYFLKDPVKYDVKYQACAQPFLILGLLVTALATSH